MLARRHYRLLHALNKTGKLGSAAMELGITQSAATHQLKEAERRLGLKLVKKAGRNISLTWIGGFLASKGAEAEEILSRAEFEAAYFDRGNKESLKIAVGVNDLMDWYPATAGKINRHLDGFVLEAVRCRYGQELQLIMAGVADVAIVAYCDTCKDLPSLPLASGQLKCLVSEAEPVTQDKAISVEELVKQTFISYNYIPKPGFEYETLFVPNSVFPKSITLVESLQTVLGMVSLGMGVTILPECIARLSNLNNIAMKDIEGAEAPIDYHLTHNPNLGSAKKEQALELMHSDLHARMSGWQGCAGLITAPSFPDVAAHILPPV